jgi:hypothetical protein
MEDESQAGKILKWALGAAGLGAVAAGAALPLRFAVPVILAILLLFLLLFGGYFLWRKYRAKRQREQFSSVIEAQTSAAPKSISDPNKRADLDRVRQKFQSGMQEFRSRGKDLYKLPWHVIIGESGSGKTEAIRHSGIDFPPGLQDELQGSGGTVNMDWWFTNRGIILDTAGAMLFNESKAGEAPEWREFLRLLKKARPHCPINGLFLVLSVESLIRDSSDTIAQKASRIAQQLDLIQRTLDVRFPVYLLVTKCDLLTGFREFFDSIDDPLLQHQMFGWSNPDPLDSHFRPDLVEQHLRSITTRLCRRRLALLRQTSSTGYGDTQQFFSTNYAGARVPSSRRMDEVDSLFALPESVMRLAPRLRRYLETIFVAGEWSAKPVFLRGIYFTSSMREGKALDEAIALATGLTLDQLPEERSWEKNRAFFLRDLFHEKVFRESGLVTRATNTLKMLRQRQLLIFGTAGLALVFLMVFAGLAYRDLRQNVLSEADYWRAATNVNKGVWSTAVVTPGQPPDIWHFSYQGTNLIPVGTRQMAFVDYQRALKATAEKKFSVGLVFKPMVLAGIGKVKERGEAQRLFFEGTVVNPLVNRSREKMQSELPADAAAVNRHRDALLALIRLEADVLAGNVTGGTFGSTNAAQKAESYLRAFVSYLTDTPYQPDTNLVSVFAWTYSPRGSGAGKWPPAGISGGTSLSNNPAIAKGLDNFRKANQAAEAGITNEVQSLNLLFAALEGYQKAEHEWLQNPGDACATLAQAVQPVKAALDQALVTAAAGTNYAKAPLTNVAARYLALEEAAGRTSAAAFGNIASELPDDFKTRGIIAEISEQLRRFASEAGTVVRKNLQARTNALAVLDPNFIAPKFGVPQYEMRWSLYTGACAVASTKVTPDDKDIGSKWERFVGLNRVAEQYRNNLLAYNGPLAPEASNACYRISGAALERLRTGFVANYALMTAGRLQSLGGADWDASSVTNAGAWLARVKADLDAAGANGIADSALAAVSTALTKSKQQIVSAIDSQLGRTVGFPVLLNSTDNKSIADLDTTRNLLLGLGKELQQSIWQTGDCPPLAPLKANCESYLVVLNGLLGDNGAPAEWEIRFVPPEQDSDRAIINVYRYLQVTLGTKTSNWEELTRLDAPLAVGTGPVDGKLQVSFRKLETDNAAVASVNYATWGLVRLIRENAGDRLDEGKRWRFKVKLEDSQKNIGGSVTFEAALKKPLPKREDWPGSKK